jgi:hypothetical protein
MFSILTIYLFFLFSIFVDLSDGLYCRCECCVGHGCTRMHLETLEMENCNFCSPMCESTYPHLCKPEHSSYKRAVKCERDPPGPIEDPKLDHKEFDVLKNVFHESPSHATIR